MSTLPTIKELVLRQLKINLDIPLKDCQQVVPGLKKANFYKIKKEYKEGSRQVDTTTKKGPGASKNKNPTSTKYSVPDDQDLPLSIDDPNELLKHVCTQELLKTRDSKWATLLFQILSKTNELGKITNQGADTELARLSISSLVNKLKEKSRDARSEETSLLSGNMQNQST